MPPVDDLDRAIREIFGHDRFREGQRDAAEAVLAGRDLVAVMPTGAGKSLCYQLPALLISGTTVVVSPLIALMKDQIDGLRELGLPAAAIHSGLTRAARETATADFAAGRLRLLYVAPERLGLPAFARILEEASVARLVVDEAHCISQWGHDFRPDYRRLGALRERLGVPTSAFTATATPDVRSDIIQQLGLSAPVEMVTGFERPNLTLAVDSCRTRVDKRRALGRIIASVGTPGIVYAATRRNAEEWAGVLDREGLRAGCYHGGLPDGERTRIQDAFLGGEIDAIAATNAFGMGVDKSNIRFVVHADIPGSVESYYQEAGRAGRDGAPARCTLLFSSADLRTQEFFLRGSNPSPAVFRQVWTMLGEGLDEEEIEHHEMGDAAQRMAAQTAARLLRQAAEERGVRIGCGEVPLDLGRTREKARRDQERLETMVRYAFTHGCRTGFIYDYFAGGAAGGAAPRCGTCDSCSGVRREGLRPPDDDEYERVRIALSGVAHLSGRFGVGRVAQVLVGSRAREVLQWRLDRVPTYGKLSSASLETAKNLLEVLIEAGLVERRTIEGGRPGAFVVSITRDGVNVMTGKTRPELPLPERLAPPPRAERIGTAGSAPPDENEVRPDPEVLERLKQWRRREATRRGVPAYIIFHDRTLEVLSSTRPRDRETLRGVKGIGPRKLEDFGEDLLSILR
jgi:ATP-dependent DNA helicase RecQ